MSNYKIFDLIKIINPNNIKYIHSPQNGRIMANGIWQVSALIDNDLIIVKNNITVRIPSSDVLKIVDYDLSNFTSNLGKLSRHGESERQENTT